MYADSLPIFFANHALLCLLCITLSLIDTRHGIIPDWLNLSIGGLGAAHAVITAGAAAAGAAAAEGVIAGTMFWLLRRLYFWLRKSEGLGLGDVKFLAVAAIWVGISGLPTLVLIASLGALAALGVLRLAGQRMTRQTALPFGPFLATALLITLALQRWVAMT